MAILNIKNLPDHLYERLRARAKREHRSIAQEATHLLATALNAPEALSLLALRGLGKADWKNIDAGEHVERERAAWD